MQFLDKNSILLEAMSTMRAEEFCSRRSQKVSVPTVNSVSNDKRTGTRQEKGRKTAHRQGSQVVEVCHSEVKPSYEALRLTRIIHIVISCITASTMRANSYQTPTITGVMSR